MYIKHRNMSSSTYTRKTITGNSPNGKTFWNIDLHILELQLTHANIDIEIKYFDINI